MTQDTASLPQPLTLLAEDERIFRDSVREFAEAQVRPLVREMDEHAKIPRTLVDAAVRARRHGHRDPRDATAAPAARSSTRSSRSRSSRASIRPIGVLVDVQNTLVINAFLRWGNDEIKQRYLPRLAADTVGAYALSEAGSGSDAFALTTRARRGRRRLRHQRPQAVDHQRQRSRPLHRLCDGRSRTPATAASLRSSSSAASPGSPSARRKTSSASAPAAPAS